MLASFIVAGMFMYAGFLLITSVGDTSKIQKAKEIFRRVVIGFLIMLLAYITVKNLVEKLNLDESVKGLFMNLFK
jgi:VIT1/CCC1 family predicted Fe2+/Mn2+ transporter